MIKLSSQGRLSFKQCLGLIRASGKSRTVVDPIVAQQDQLEARVLEYARKRRRLEEVNASEFQPDISVELKDCYDNMPSKLTAEIVAYHRKVLHGLHVCPYCLISEADSKDHYLPKEDFPEYAFLACNLIPCCTNCNRRKGRFWVENGQRIFHNPFFDPKPDRILTVRLSISRADVSFYLVKDQGVLASHVKRLDLIERYNDQGAGVLSNIISLIETFPEMKDDREFKKQMKIEYRKSVMRFGGNHYTSLIYEELMSSGLSS